MAVADQRYVCTGANLIAIADAIRAKAKTSEEMTLAKMALSVQNLASIEKVGEGDYFWGFYADQGLANAITDAEAAVAMINGQRVYASFKTLINPARVSWVTSTEAEIQAAVEAAWAFGIDLSKYWSVGDSRTINISAMSATGVGESHAAQTAEVVLMDMAPNYTTTDGKTPKLLWGLKNSLKETGYMNSSNTNSGGWSSCARRTWCNNVFYPALPSFLRNITKTVNVVAANGSSTTTATSQDKCFLLAEKEIFGGVTYANSTAEASLRQVPYYADANNRIMKLGTTGSAGGWWERSPASGRSGSFCLVPSGGTAGNSGAGYAIGLAPCGCA